MKNTINVHAQFSGVAAEEINYLILNGYASNRTEAIRHALLECRNLHRQKQSEFSDEDKGWRMLSEQSLAKALDNPKDEEAAKWYKEQFKKGAYDELNKPKKK